MSSVTGASMSYTHTGYAKGVLIRYGLKLVNWPADIPFVNLSDIRGGVDVLERLHALWLDGTLHFERATPEDLANAAADPTSVHPNRALFELEQQRRAQAAAALSQSTVVAPAALHPGTLMPLGVLPTSTRPGVATLGVRPRSQRRDVKKARRRPVTNPANLPLRRPKPGVKSARYVLEWEEEERPKKRVRFALVDEPIEEIIPFAGGARGGVWFGSPAGGALGSF